ncbi:MAG: PQQ-like beta-propeller repeat protein [Deltaproteobacteria bacterium]|nr:PQQ-like beta-propeller repeat protein [Deltaproteobacteria bacterium]
MGERIRLEAGSGGVDIDFSSILDTIDILIGGANVSALAHEDAVFLMLRDMLAGCEDLASGRTPRVTLPFYESPWELVLKREGDTVLASFFRGGMNPHIEVKDRAVRFQDLVLALVVAGDALLARLESLNPKILADPFVGEIFGALERLRAMDRIEACPHEDGPPVELASDASGEPHSDIAFRFAISATFRDLLGPTTPSRADLYSLMARGQLSCLVRGEEVLVVEGHVYFMVDALLLLARRLLDCLEERKDLDLVLQGDALRVESHYDATSELLTVTLAPDARRSTSGPAVVGGVPLVSFVDSVLDLGRSLRRQILDVNPGQRTNLKFELLSSEIENLGSWRRDLTAGAVVNTGGSQLRYERPRPTLPRRDDEGRLLMARRLMYSKRWDVEAEGLRLDATFLCGDRIVMGTRSIVAALDRDSGDLLWRQGGIPSRALALMTGESGLLTVAPSGEVGLIDIADGSTVWQNRIQPPPGKPVGITAGGGRRPRYAVLTTEESGLVAFDLFTGEARWRFRTRRGSPSGFARFGRLIAFSCNSNSVYCLDADSGELVWRFSDRSRFDLPPVSLGESLMLWSADHGGQQGTVFCLDSLTGEAVWRARVLGKPLAPPVLSSGHVVMAVRSARGVSLESWTGQGRPGWRRDLEDLDGPVALMSMDDAVIVHTSYGSVASLDGATGSVRWMHSLTDSPGVELPLSLEPVLRDGGLFVPFDTTYVLNPIDGSLLHRLEGDSPVPDLLRVDENYSIYTAEVSGHVSAYGLVGHLDIVPS